MLSSVGASVATSGDVGVSPATSPSSDVWPAIRVAASQRASSGVGRGDGGACTPAGASGAAQLQQKRALTRFSLPQDGQVGISALNVCYNHTDIIAPAALVGKFDQPVAGTLDRRRSQDDPRQLGIFDIIGQTIGTE